MARIEELTGKDPMKILIASSEMAPFAKTGGLGDVIAALGSRLSLAGHDVKVFLPKFSSVYQTGVSGKTREESRMISINGADYPLRWETYHDKNSGLEVVFVINDDLYHRPDIYTDRETGLDYQDNDVRFIFLSRATLEISKRMKWKPDVAHANDWQTGLIPVYLKTLYREDSFFEGTRSLLTIHNVAYQGVFKKESLLKLGISGDYMLDPAVFTQRGKLNILKAATAHADKLNTVSERYASEIQTVEYGYGLQRALRSRNADLLGTLNGVDYSIWDPSTDVNIAQTYDSSRLSLKAKNKSALQRQVGLPVRNKHAMIGMVTRLTKQKGIELLVEIADDVLGLDVQMVVLGDGDKKYVKALQAIQKRHPKKFRAVIGFDDQLAHQIEAGCDMFMMPSLYEPCGLNQMYSLRYGTVPIVRETGGLADTIVECDNQRDSGNGFVFKNFSSDELLEAFCRAHDLFLDKRSWKKLQKRGMAEDFSWNTAVGRYEKLYRATMIVEEPQMAFEGATAV
jgi:starch synthase